VTAAAGAWDDALLAAALLAVDPVGLGGVAVHAPAGPVRDAWMDAFRARLATGIPVRRMPARIEDDRLLGGLDLAATLRAGRTVAMRGLLSELDGGVLIAGMAERIPAATAARLAAALDTGAVTVEREGVRERHAARFGLVLLDEGEEDGEEQPPAALLDRLAFRLDLSGLGMRDVSGMPAPAELGRVGAVACADEFIEALCGAAMALGVASVRASVLAVRVACAAAALAGRAAVTAEDAAVAARLVLAPRATRLPQSAEAPTPEQAPDEQTPPPDQTEQDAADDTPADGKLDDRVLEAAEAAIPAGLLARLLDGGAARVKRHSEGKAGAMQRGAARGRPAGSRPGDPRAGQRLDVIATLRAAAPWQGLRRLESLSAGRILVRRDDLRVVRRRQRRASVAIFVVDASGSAALNRLAEAKGAVELLLADCYVRRDQVALIAFRGRQAELLLPPTRSLARARRLLAGLPGGGGTPLCAGIEAATDLADGVRRRGQSPLVVLLTDGRPNVARDGMGGRPRAEADSLAAAQRLRASGMPALMVDVAPLPHPFAARIASAMGARYLALPAAQSATITCAVQAALAG
jgi:magnesium chelatase subunit D